MELNSTNLSYNRDILIREATESQRKLLIEVVQIIHVNFQKVWAFICIVLKLFSIRINIIKDAYL